MLKAFRAAMSFVFFVPYDSFNFATAELPPSPAAKAARISPGASAGARCMLEYWSSRRSLRPALLQQEVEIRAGLMRLLCC